METLKYAFKIPNRQINFNILNLLVLNFRFWSLWSPPRLMIPLVYWLILGIIQSVYKRFSMMNAIVCTKLWSVQVVCSKKKRETSAAIGKLRKHRFSSKRKSFLFLSDLARSRRVIPTPGKNCQEKVSRSIHTRVTSKFNSQYCGIHFGRHDKSHQTETRWIIWVLLNFCAILLN